MGLGILILLLLFVILGIGITFSRFHSSAQFFIIFVVELIKYGGPIVMVNKRHPYSLVCIYDC